MVNVKTFFMEVDKKQEKGISRKLVDGGRGFRWGRGRESPRDTLRIVTKTRIDGGSCSISRGIHV